MLRILGLTLASCLMGCATQVAPRPAGVSAVSTRSTAATENTAVTESPAGIEHSAGPASSFDFLSVRVGVEYTPSQATDRETAAMPVPVFRAHAPSGDGHERDKVTVVGLRPTTPPAAEASSVETVSEAWMLGNDEIRKVEDPYEKAVLEFVDDLIGADRRRLQREFGAPVLLTRSPRTHLPSLHNAYDERLEEEQAEFNNDVISSLVRGPLQHAMRTLPLVAGIEAEFEHFKADNVPVTEAYQAQHGGASWGRMSASLRIHDSFDPLELSYLNYGFRVGSSQHYLRLEYDIDLCKGLHASVGWKKGYDNQTHDFVRASLHWRIDKDNQLHVTAGDSLHFLDGPTAYENVDSRLDGARGILFYVEHLF